MAKNQSMEELSKLSIYKIPHFKQNDIVEGTVVGVTNKEVLVDVGGKSEGIILGEERVTDDQLYKNLKVGDRVIATVIYPEDERGYLVLSLKRAEKIRKWRDLTNAFKSESVLEVEVIEYNKGGLVVDLWSMRAFIPLSHLDRVHFAEINKKTAEGGTKSTEEKLNSLIGKKLSGKIIEIDEEKNRIVLSEKDITQAVTDEELTALVGDIKEGDTLEGVVSGIMPFGLFIEIITREDKSDKNKFIPTGIEGLVHISEISWEKVNHPSDHFNVGDILPVMVISKNENENKLELSVKRLQQNPWIGAKEKYPENTKVKGIVTKIESFGAFVRLEPGLEGLIHISEAAGPVEVGKEVEAIVLNVDERSQKLALSTRRIEEKVLYK